MLPNYSPTAVIDTHIEELLLPCGANLFQALVTMEKAKKFGLPPGLVLVVDQQNRLKGTLTDGDVRRALMQGHMGQVPIEEIMTRTPVFVRVDVPLTGVLDEVCRQVESIGKQVLIKYPVLLDEDDRVLGIIDLSKFMLAQTWHWDKIAIVGLGYAGLTLAVSLAEVGFHVVGWEVDPLIRSNLQKGISHVYEPGLESLLSAQLADRRFIIPDSGTAIRDCHVYIITVSTPYQDGAANLNFLRQAIETTAPYLKPGDLVILRSTVPVGTCRTVVRKTIESSTAVKVGPDISIAFAPERTVEGRALEELRTLPQIIGGFDQWSLESASRIFSRLTSTVVHMKSLEEAELVKLINNASRDLSFAFANQIAEICEQYNHDAFRVIEAANLGYPRNPVAFPSPGVGGSCLKKDPYFMAALCPSHLPDLLSIGRRINESMPERVSQRVTRALKEVGKPPSSVQVFILGFAFKGDPETTDLRDSPTLQLVELLRGHVDKLLGFDPIVPRPELEARGIEWCPVDEGFSRADAVLFMNNHRDFTKLDVYRLAKTMKNPGVLFDGWHLFNPEEIEKIQGLRYMGLGYATPWSKE
jgi:UDP-N-acetyl-D-mannosaminuronic acid dehydrogenase